MSFKPVHDIVDNAYIGEVGVVVFSILVSRARLHMYIHVLCVLQLAVESHQVTWQGPSQIAEN